MQNVCTCSCHGCADLPCNRLATTDSCGTTSQSALLAGQARLLNFTPQKCTSSRALAILEQQNSMLLARSPNIVRVSWRHDASLAASQVLAQVPCAPEQVSGPCYCFSICNLLGQRHDCWMVMPASAVSSHCVTANASAVLPPLLGTFISAPCYFRLFDAIAQQAHSCGCCHRSYLYWPFSPLATSPSRPG